MSNERPFYYSKNDYPPWNLIDSDADFFTDMINRFGIKGVAAKDVLAVNDLDSLSKVTTHAIVLAFQCNEEPLDKRTMERDRDTDELVFTAQVVLNSCATLSILNAVSNLDIERGNIIQNFLDFTRDFNSIDRGTALGSVREIELIHNSYKGGEGGGTMDANTGEEQANYEEELTQEDTGSLTPQVHENLGVCHFVSYIWKNGYIWELDGMKRYPIKLVAATDDENWLLLLKPFLIKKIESSNSVANLMALVKSSVARKETQLKHFIVKYQELSENASKEMKNLNDPSTSSDPLGKSKLIEEARHAQQEKKEWYENIVALKKDIAEAKKEEVKRLSTLDRVHNEYYNSIINLASVAVRKGQNLQDFWNTSENIEIEDGARVTRSSTRERITEAIPTATTTTTTTTVQEQKHRGPGRPKSKGKTSTTIITEPQNQQPRGRPRRNAKAPADEQEYKPTDNSSDSSADTRKSKRDSDDIETSIKGAAKKRHVSRN